MMRSRSLSTRAWLGGLAAGGVVLTHWLAYRTAVPHDADRAELLASTGHGYWKFVVAATLGALVAALARFACGHVWRGAAMSRGHLYVFTATRLVVLQAIGFTALECGEHLLARVPVTHLLSEPAVVLGVVGQTVIALVAALLLVAFAKVVELIASAVCRTAPARSRRVPPARPPRRTFVRIPEVALGSGSLRGPPVRI